MSDTPSPESSSPGPEQLVSSKPFEQARRQISEKTKNLLNRFTGWTRRQNPNPDAALQAIATFPLKEPEQIEQDTIPSAEEPKEVLDSQAQTNPLASITNTETEEKNNKNRVFEAIKKVQKERNDNDHLQIFPAAGIRGDGDSIEGQQIDFISQTDDNIAVRFKLTEQYLQAFQEKILPGISDQEKNDGTYNFLDIKGRSFSLGKAVIIKVDNNTKISISSGEKQREEMERSDTVDDQPFRSLIGAVSIEVSGLTNYEEIAARIDKAFKKIGLENALIPPDTKHEEIYKINRFKWQHKLDEEAFKKSLEEYKGIHGENLVDHLQIDEVFPGYFTVVDNGASKRFQKGGPINLAHTLNESALESILRNGLLSRHDLYKRGIRQEGIAGSGLNDFTSGGADNVFIGCFTDNISDLLRYSPVTLIIDPSILDRTDWYAYNQYKGGTTSSEEFKMRPSPEAFFANERANHIMSNEIMMRRGIPTERIKSLVVNDEIAKKALIEKLSSQGITNVGNKTIEELITTKTDFLTPKSDVQ